MLSNIHENIWTDGCFDLFHYGHANHLRQAKSMATNLIVGLHSDMDIAENKKNSVTCLSERMFVMNSIKYVNKVVINTPYVTDLNILNQNNCHFCIHGNDKPLCVNGQDPYRFVKENGRYKSCARTRFISTTEIIERVLFPSFERNLTRTNVSSYSYLVGLLDKFREGHYLPCSGDNVVYIGGKFDILHPFLLHYLKKLKSPDNYLIVGVYSDQDIRKNLNFYPTLNSLERCLALSACRFVDWVVLDAPFKMKKDFIRHYNIGKIYYGDCDFNTTVRNNKYSHIDEKLLSINSPPKELSCDFLWDRIREYRHDHLKAISSRKIIHHHLS